MPDEANSKAKRDLRSVQDSVNRVELARKQLAELLGEDYEGAGVVETTAAMVGAEAATVGTSANPQAEHPAQVVLPGGQSVQAQAESVQQDVQPPVQQPVQHDAQQPTQQPGTQAPHGQQDGYWRGFQPVQPVQSVQPQPQPAQPPVQAGYTYPTQPQPQPMQAQPVPAQPVQPVQPVQPTQRQTPSQAQPGHVYSAQPMQPQPAQPQPGYTQPQQPQSQQGYASPQQSQAQPAGYNQVYTPQIQQPAGYVPAQDFAVQPQPATPAYEKSNKSTLAIVLACVIGLLAIIAAIIIGRILATNSGSESTLFDQFPSIEEGHDNEDGYYNEHNWGGGNNAIPPLDDDWGFNWDDDNAITPDDHGAVHIYGGGVDADDGELHDAFVPANGYEIQEEEYDREGIERIDFYNKTIAYDFDVEYPQLRGNIANLDKINAAIKDKAMRFVDSTYTAPTSDARAMVETYADTGFGVPSGVDAILESDVDYAITYNTENFISICFSDEYAIGSWLGESISLRTININLKTGEVYELNDVLTLNDSIAEDFIDNLSTYDGGAAEQAAGRKSLVGAIQGKGSEADNVTTTFFVDGNGKVNVGVSYFLTGNNSVARGWWDYTLTAEQLEKAKKDSSLWDCVK